MRVRFPPVPPVASTTSFVSFSGPGYVWRRWLTVYEYLGEFDSRQGRLGLRHPMERYSARTGAMGVRVPSSPLLRLALVVEQSGTRLQPVHNPVQLRASAPATD